MRDAYCCHIPKHSTKVLRTSSSTVCVIIGDKLHEGIAVRTVRAIMVPEHSHRGALSVRRCQDIQPLVLDPTNTLQRHMHNHVHAPRTFAACASHCFRDTRGHISSRYGEFFSAHDASPLKARPHALLIRRMKIFNFEGVIARSIAVSKG